MLNVRGKTKQLREPKELGQDKLASRHLKILIADDDPLVVRFLQRASKKFDKEIHVDTASNGYDADLKIVADRPDIIILDVYMPGLRGDELCRKIKSGESTRDILVLAVTGYYDESLRRKLVQSGADVVMAKPLEAAKIISLLEELAARL